MARRKYEDLSVTEVRIRMRQILKVQRGLLHDEPTTARDIALKACGEALACCSTLLDYDDPYDADFVYGLKTSIDVASEAGDKRDFRYLLRMMVIARNKYDLKHGTEQIPRIDTTEMPPDDLYDGWVWSDEAQGFVNDDIRDDSSDQDDGPDLFGDDSDDDDGPDDDDDNY